MIREEAQVIKDFSKCDFTEINEYYKQKSEERKAMSKEEKAVLKEENQRIVEEYGWCMIDGHKEKIGNFKIEPPGLFRGRGDHPKQGRIKVRCICVQAGFPLKGVPLSLTNSFDVVNGMHRMLWACKLFIISFLA